MSADAAEPPTGIAPEAPSIELERADPKTPEETFARYVALMEKGLLGTTEFPPYYVQITLEAQPGLKAEISTHVKSHKAALDELLSLFAVLEDFNEMRP